MEAQMAMVTEVITANLNWFLLLLLLLLLLPPPPPRPLPLPLPPPPAAAATPSTAIVHFYSNCLCLLVKFVPPFLLHVLLMLPLHATDSCSFRSLSVFNCQLLFYCLFVFLFVC